MWLKTSIGKDTLKREIYNDNFPKQYDIFAHLFKTIYNGKDHIKIEDIYKNVCSTRVSPFH